MQNVERQDASCATPSENDACLAGPGWRALKEKNRKDFDETTQQITHALERLREDETLKLTQKHLAEMSGVCRRTLHNRGWPIEELKQIKGERSEDTLPTQRREAEDQPEGTSGDRWRKKSKPGIQTDPPKADQLKVERDSQGNPSETSADSSKVITNYRRDNARLFDEAENLREQVRKLNTENRLLEAKNERLIRDLEHLRVKLGEVKPNTS